MSRGVSRQRQLLAHVCLAKQTRRRHIRFIAFFGKRIRRQPCGTDYGGSAQCHPFLFFISSLSLYPLFSCNAFSVWRQGTFLTPTFDGFCFPSEEGDALKPLSKWRREPGEKRNGTRESSRVPALCYRSMISAIPWPPPMHAVTNPRLPPLRLSS